VFADRLMEGDYVEADSVSMSFECPGVEGMRDCKAFAANIGSGHSEIGGNLR
jgi:hypothetical protein